MSRNTGHYSAVRPTWWRVHPERFEGLLAITGETHGMTIIALWHRTIWRFHGIWRHSITARSAFMYDQIRSTETIDVRSYANSQWCTQSSFAHCSNENSMQSEFHVHHEQWPTQTTCAHQHTRRNALNEMSWNSYYGVSLCGRAINNMIISMLDGIVTSHNPCITMHALAGVRTRTQTRK